MIDSHKSIVDNLRIASPCPKLWSDMELTEAESKRFCGDCKKNVYDVSKMSVEETSLLLQIVSARASVCGSAEGESDGRAGTEEPSVCLQLYRRADGTVITDDCPVGLRRVRDRMRRLQKSAASFVAMILCQIGLSGCIAKADPLDTTMAAGGFCPRIDWEAEGLKNPEIKAAIGKLKALESKSVPSPADDLQKCKLNFEIARLGVKCKVPNFSRPYFDQAWLMADKLKERDLLSQIDTARKENNQTLGIQSDTPNSKTVLIYGKQKKNVGAKNENEDKK